MIGNPAIDLVQPKAEYDADFALGIAKLPGSLGRGQ
jgi:hypothetical protein